MWFLKFTELPRFRNQLAGDGSERPQATRTSGRSVECGGGVSHPYMGRGKGGGSANKIYVNATKMHYFYNF